MIQRLFKRLKKLRSKWHECALNSAYFVRYQKRKLRSRVALVESRSGEDLASNMFYMAKEMEKRGIQVYVPYKEMAREKIENIIRAGGLSRVRMVPMYSRKYYKLLAVAKYLFNDVCFDWKYIKRQGQVYVNTWHGTPLKTIGFDVAKEKYVMGNIQRNLMMADYLTSPSDYFTERMLHAYHIDKLFSGTILRSGYPRNSVFFDQALRADTRAALGLGERQMIVYVPTWRGSHADPTQGNILQQHLAELDALLGEDQILYVKLHNMDRQSIQLEDFVHVREFPTQMECYQVLAAADCLVTDYSSVFFDFANSGRKIILFTYDKREYFAQRGVYFSMDKLPFPQVTTPQALVDALRAPMGYCDKAFRETYCTYDKATSSADIAAHIFGERVLDGQRVTPNGKKNILIYCGGIMLKNGIITSLKNLLSGLDFEEHNYFFAFTRQGLSSQPALLEELPDGLQLYPIASPLQPSLMEAWGYRKYFYQRKDKRRYKRYWNRLMERELEKHFPRKVFDTVIDFEGYGTHQMVPIIQRYPGRRMIFAHSNMADEMNTRDNQHPYVLREAYRDFDVVAVVSEDLKEPTAKISGRTDNIVVVSNSHNYLGIRKRAEMPISFEPDSEMRTWNPGGIDGVLSCKGYKFISIGRFSPEKGHMRLLDAFDRFCDRYTDTQLIIIGGHGFLYDATLRYIQRMRHWKNVTVIRSMQNPMPILKQCDLFILPSMYEGLGLVMLEADCLGVPSFATDMDGPRKFMERYRGHRVENSAEGILQGMYDFVDGKVHTFDIDYAQYNRQALDSFKALL